MTRSENEIRHGQYLASGDAIEIWGWGTPAGRKRAERRADLIREAAGLAPNMRALEIGCGTGNFTEKFLESGASILAVDISSDLLAIANDMKTRRGFSDENVKFLNQRFEECNVNEPFDAVIGSSVLHHLNCDEAFRKIRDLLKPSGKMVFAEPNMLNPQVFLERHFRTFYPYVSKDETAFVRFPLAKQLERAGFTNIRIMPFDWLHPSTPEHLIPFVDKLGAILEKTPGLREFAGSLLIVAEKPSA
ncbi:MAG TPA: hypothetical protein DCW68_04965 [Rhodospirillaceae bacterium]|nr:MAG: hypothetical protein A2018_02680 [Alphaproteobacteria bacterium GWF2_58_20]HAU29447.1 hypothetical protein [Rhodospirillaceae bacterium]